MRVHHTTPRIGFCALWTTTKIVCSFLTLTEPMLAALWHSSSCSHSWWFSWRARLIPTSISIFTSTSTVTFTFNSTSTQTPPWPVIHVVVFGASQLAVHHHFVQRLVSEGPGRDHRHRHRRCTACPRPTTQLADLPRKAAPRKWCGYR